jgi:uncharacterized protein YqiB (DUF1249 family)
MSDPLPKLQEIDALVRSIERQYSRLERLANDPEEDQITRSFAAEMLARIKVILEADK